MFLGPWAQRENIFGPGGENVGHRALPHKVYWKPLHYFIPNLKCPLHNVIKAVRGLN